MCKHYLIFFIHVPAGLSPSHNYRKMVLSSWRNLNFGRAKCIIDVYVVSCGREPLQNFWLVFWFPKAQRAGQCNFAANCLKPWSSSRHCKRRGGYMKSVGLFEVSSVYTNVYMNLTAPPQPTSPVRTCDVTLPNFISTYGWRLLSANHTDDQ